MKSSRPLEQPPSCVFCELRSICPSDLDMHSLPSPLVCGDEVGCVLRKPLFVLYFLDCCPHERPFLWEAQRRAELKDLTELNYALLGQWFWQWNYQISWWPDRRKPTRVIGTRKRWRKCGNVKMGFSEKDLQEPEGSGGLRGIVRGWQESDWKDQKVWENQWKEDCHQVEENEELFRVRQKACEIFQVLSSHQ